MGKRSSIPNIIKNIEYKEYRRLEKGSNVNKTYTNYFNIRKSSVVLNAPYGDNIVAIKELNNNCALLFKKNGYIIKVSHILFIEYYPIKITNGSEFILIKEILSKYQ